MSATGGRARTRRDRAGRRGADHGGHRLGSRPRRRRHQEATHTKKIIFHPKMLPKIVICDPELTVGMPPRDHGRHRHGRVRACLEAYCAPSYHPIADGIAVEGMRLVFENLPKAVARRQRSRGARPYDERGGDGRDRLPEGARRHPCAVASGRRALSTRIMA